jgi:hypothetical protein
MDLMAHRDSHWMMNGFFEWCLGKLFPLILFHDNEINVVVKVVMYNKFKSNAIDNVKTVDKVPLFTVGVYIFSKSCFQKRKFRKR